MTKYNRVYAKIDLNTIVYNLEEIKSNIDANTKIMAVIKADGYGHGAIPIAKQIESRDYLFGFAVATAEEAIALRQSGILKPIMILGYVFPEHYEEIVEYNIISTIFEFNTAKKLSDIALTKKKNIEIHIKIDTGMSRIGLKDNPESIEIIKEIIKLPLLETKGIFTHFAKADETDRTFTIKQLERFKRFAEALEKEGISIPLKHCSNSGGIIEYSNANMDIVRAGISLYGLYPSSQVSRTEFHLKPALELISHVVCVKEVEAGAGISYGGTFVTVKATKVATIPIGYGDGYPRSLSNKGWVLIKGKKAPILGRICMDQFMVDVSHIDQVAPGDEVTLIGRNGDLNISVDQLGDLSGRFNYEFVCDLGKRIPRVYVLNNKIIDTVE